jgi:hypothetical protein
MPGLFIKAIHLTAILGAAELEMRRTPNATGAFSLLEVHLTGARHAGAMSSVQEASYCLDILRPGFLWPGLFHCHLHEKVL